MGDRKGSAAAKKAGPIETELRLTGDPDVLQAVFAEPPVAGEGHSEEKISDLASVYFDTSNLDLRARGLAFRVRADGTRFKQTLKSGDKGQAALLKRGEWETALKNRKPKLDALPDDAKACIPVSVWKDGLQQVFETKLCRRVREIRWQDDGRAPARIEAALDLGEILTKQGNLPIAELELELVEGQADTLYQLALKLQEMAPLTVETRSKSTRAFEQLANRPPSCELASTPPLRQSHAVDEAMAAIFWSCFDQWLANQAAAIDGRDPEGVHQMRVALRRLRSALSVFRKLIPEDQYAWLQTEAKQIIAALGPARDWDVFYNELLAPVIEARPDDRGLAQLRSKARARSRTSYQRARKHLASPDYTRFVLTFGRWLERRGWTQGNDAHAALRGQPIAKFAGSLLKKRHKRALAKGRHFADLTTEQRHELRIMLKKLRYATEFFQLLYRKKAVKPFLRSVKALQNDLGHLNDVAVAETLLTELTRRPGRQDIGPAVGLVLGWHARGVAEIEPDLREDWRQFALQPAFWG